MKKFENKVFALWAKLICFFLHKDKQGLLNRRGKTCPWVVSRKNQINIWLKKNYNLEKVPIP